MRTHRRADMTKPRVAFRNFAKASKNVQLFSSIYVGVLLVGCIPGPKHTRNYLHSLYGSTGHFISPVHGILTFRAASYLNNSHASGDVDITDIVKSKSKEKFQPFYSRYLASRMGIPCFFKLYYSFCTT
jgi:hypothetical protein